MYIHSGKFPVINLGFSGPLCYSVSAVNNSYFLATKLYLINVFIKRAVLLCGRAIRHDII